MTQKASKSVKKNENKLKGIIKNFKVSNQFYYKNI